MTVTGSLKFDISVTPQLAAKAVTLRRQWAPHRPVWIATSTHEGEESVVIAAHQALLQQFLIYCSSGTPSSGTLPGCD